MSCAHGIVDCESAFTVDASRVTFGRGCLREVGARANALRMGRVGLFTDLRVRDLPIFEAVWRSLQSARIDVVVFDSVRVEPTDESLLEAARFASEAKLTGYVSLGGGSVIDTCKAANLFASHPAELLDYVNAPVGLGKPIPGALRPHIACPTTSGTGSEVTGIIIFDLHALSVKTGIASPMIRPSEALVDPDATRTLPTEVVAASGMDVLCHALESFTARPFDQRAAPATPLMRPMSQGRNPWSDIGCREALRLIGLFFERAVRDTTDDEARQQLMWAATLAGIAFGNAGVHVPHGMSYAVAGLVRDHRPSGYPTDHAMVPHGVSVIVNAPSVFRWTAPTSPSRHLEAAALLGEDTRSAEPADAGDLLGSRLVTLMRGALVPNGLSGVGYGATDVPALAQGALAQQRLLQNAPQPIDEETLKRLFLGAISYW